MLKIQLKIFAILIMLCIKINGTAQTSGPSQPEVQSFQPVSISKMVEPSTGEFQYSVPLFTIGGYPINVNYNSKVGMENEASMVGLGFNLNCGAITRQVRGIPDDFMGDQMIKRVNMAPNITTGVNLGSALELVGYNKKKNGPNPIGLNLSSKTGLFYNTYSGWGIENIVGAGFHGNVGCLKGNAGIGINSNSQHGTSVNPYCGISYEYSKKESKEKDNAWKKMEKNIKVNPAKIKSGFSANFGAGYNFNSASYSPKIDMPFTTVSLDFSIKVGYAGSYFQIGGDVRGYRVTQKLQTNKIDNPAYGFLYADQGKDIENAMMDFNRENDGIITEDKPNLALAYATPDVYSVAGQGVGGEFELKRNNVFIGFDPKTSTNNHNGGIELEVGLGIGAHVGADLRYGYTLNTSQKWDNSSNEFLNTIDFGAIMNNSLANSEQVYFKNPSDVMFNKSSIYSITNTQPFAPTLKHIPYFGGKTYSDKIKVNTSFLNSLTTNDFTNTERANRLDVIYYLTASEANLYGIQKTIPNYKFEDFGATNFTTIQRAGGPRADNHLSEMICLKADGTRYVFNVPAYNYEKRDVSYSINEGDLNGYETDYIPTDLINVKNETKGKDDFISVTETPAYAHSFLLGNVLSPNYIDFDDNGPTENDLGDYVKFNYTRLYDDYYWRSNNDRLKATADNGNLCDKRDGKAFFSEGKKEVWYIHSVESKNEVSRFYYSDRSDAFDLKNTNKKLQRLDSILIYSRPELSNNNPVPFKRLYFDYNTLTPLCTGINGSSNSKLTLHSIYFKDGTSNKGKYSAYKFEYDNSKNPAYNTLTVDRWGNYKPATALVNDVQLDNKLFPFVKQNDKPNADINAAAWLLKKINLPSGGLININYEAHDYALVQDKRAMSMVKVESITHDKPTSLSDLNQNVLYSGSNTTNDYIIFKLKQKIPASTSNTDYIVQQNYFTDNNGGRYGRIINPNGADVNRPSNLYGKFRVSIKPNDNFIEEDIPVFLDATECGALALGGNDYDYGYVKIRKTSTRSTSGANANQISKIAWQYTKQVYPQILFGFDADPSLSNSEKFDVVVGLMNPAGGVIKSIMNTSPYDVLKSMDVANNVVLNKSYIRLYVPDGYKQGGNGARVKSIDISDNWSAMTSGNTPSSSYTINYDYTKVVNHDTISSGVASYEPEIGGEENPWKQPIFYSEKNVLMPDDNNFMMTPYGESLFPSASIIYSEVKTTENKITNPLTQVGTGYTINKYYTYNDFPCKVAQTDIELVRKPKVNFSLLKNISFDYMAATQGYVVITNDMHGKPKAEEIFGEKGNLVTAKYYKYKTNALKTLNNTVKSINKAGIIQSNLLLGVETQVYGDARRYSTETFSGDVHGNLDFQMIGIVPTIIPSAWPDFSYEKKTFSSFELTKHVRQQGILDTVIAVDKGSTIYTKNELWDEVTGAVLLTSTNNEFKDPIYNFTYPAHWAYSGMGMASDNVSAATKVSASFGIPNNFKAILQEGDLIGANNNIYVVKAKTPNLDIQPLYSIGSIFNLANAPILKIISSGKKNLATTSIGNFTSLINPISLTPAGLRLDITSSKNIIDANAIEYTNKALQTCDTCTAQKTKGGSAIVAASLTNNHNYFLYSLKNLTSWQAEASYKYVEDRVQSPNNPNLKKEGFLRTFSPFWITNIWQKSNAIPWQFTEKLNIIDSRLHPIQTVNPLNIYSSVQQSNFDGMVNATTANSKYHENLFDGFEDVKNACETYHYSILNDKLMLDNQNAHTGYYSMKTGIYGYAKTFLLDGSLRSGYITDSNFVSIECEPKLTLLKNKKYIFSAWVKERIADNTTLDYNNASVAIIYGTAMGTAKPKGQIIDGWQRIDFEFITGTSLQNLTLNFSAYTNFDDIRIYPADAMMKSYVYSYKDYSLMATLDENNFATFYEYDQQKQLKRVKKETQKGIATIQEVNFGSFKQ
jgi:hypothetical protein